MDEEHLSTLRPNQFRDLLNPQSRALLACSFVLTMILAQVFTGLFSAGLLLLGQRDNPINLLQIPGASIATLLTGAGMLGVLGSWRYLRVMSGALLGIEALYSLGQGALVAFWNRQPSPLISELTISPLPSVFLLLVASCLILGHSTRRRQSLWVTVGLILTTVGVAGLLTLVFPQFALSPQPYASNPIAVALFALVTGLSLTIAGRYCHGDTIPSPKPLVITTAGLGVASCCVIWVVLVWQQQQDLQQRADFMLSNLEFRLQRVTSNHLLLMKRMAERIDVASGELDKKVLDRDLHNYIVDNPGLRAIALLGPDSQLMWLVGRSSETQNWLDARLRHPEVRQWLSHRFTAPRMYTSAAMEADTALLVVDLSETGQTLVSSLDLRQLIANDVHMLLGNMHASVRNWDREFAQVMPDGPRKIAPMTSIVLGQQQFALPGELAISATVYPLDRPSWQLIFFKPTIISGTGLFVSWLFTFCVGMVFLERGRSRDLLEAKNQMRTQRRIQDMIVRETPLKIILEAICQMLEQQLPGALCSVMLKDPSGKGLTLMAGPSLPEVYRQAAAHVEIAPNLGACGAAVYFNKSMVCEDLTTDPHWADHQDVVRQSGLRSAWSCLVRGSNGTVLGTFAIYRRQPAAPDEAELTQVDRASALVALAVERAETQQSNQLLRRGVEASVNGVIIADANLPDLPIIYANKAFFQITGYSPEEVIGRNCRFLQGPETDVAAIAELRENIANRQEVHVTLLNYRKDGQTFWNDLHVAPVRDNQGQVSHFVGIQHDITSRKAHEEQLAHHAHHDALTGLPNRTLLEDRLIHDHALADREGFLVAVLFIDLDEFKPINDTLGHAVGDLLLQEVAQRLSLALREGDTVARLGGDEFVVVLPRLEQEDQAIQVAERILAQLAHPYQIQDYELYLTATIGIAVSRGEISNPLELIQQADMAMYKAKEKGRNDYQFFTEDFTGKARDRVAKRTALQGAIGRDELELHYQPIFSRDHELTGVEALLRWNRPGHGYVSPAEFIPLAESTGQIVPISEWVVERACLDMESLHTQGLGRLRVAVNLSPIQFQRANFLSQIFQTLQNTGFPSNLLEVELTEGILMNDQEAAIRILQGLKAMNIGVSIDDFGTGYSSLSYLRVMPINKIKIDRSFVMDITEDDNDKAIVAGIIAMAHHLGFTVVAEGVETEEQWRALADLDCDLFQGYLLARPMTLANLRDLVAKTIKP